MSLAFPASPSVGQIYQSWQWNGTVWAPVPGGIIPAAIALEVQLTADQTGVAAGTWTTVKYNTKVTDLQNAYSTATGLFTPTQAGLYLVTATAAAGTTVNSFNGIAICKNGALTSAESQTTRIISGGSGAATSQNAAALINCNGVNDSISVQAITSGTSFFGPTSATNVVNMVATLLQTGPQGPIGPAGPWNLLSTQNGAGLAAVVFLLTGGYRRYKMLLDNIVAVTSGAQGILQVSEDGGTTWKTANNYLSAINMWGSAGATGVYGTAIGLNLFGGTDLSVAASNMPAAAEVTMFNPGGPYMPVTWHTAPFGASLFNCTGVGRWSGDNAAINAVRFQMTSGNIQSCTASLYGIQS